MRTKEALAEMKSLRKAKKCICPKCEKIHKKKLYFTGRGTPRIYCTSCDAFAKNNFYEEEYL